jgi:hypothetical protein
VPVVVIGVSPDVVGVVTGTLGVSGVVETDTGVGDVVFLEARHDSICFSRFDRHSYPQVAGFPAPSQDPRQLMNEDQYGPTQSGWSA